MTSLGNEGTFYFVLPISSNFVNVANFVIFDITLISLVYYFTAEIIGRLNDAELSNGHQKRLYIFCPPLLGGGLCSTVKFRLFLCMGIRLFAFILVLAANMTIEGVTQFPLEMRTVSVLTFGALQNLTSSEVQKYIEKRRRCKGIKSGRIYYGEIRNGKCELKTRLLSKPVFFETNFTSVKIQDPSKNSSCQKRKTKPGSSLFSLYRCPNATIVCLDPGYIRPESCRAVVRVRKQPFVCDYFLFAGRTSRDKWEGECVQAYNLDSREINWPSLAEHKHAWTIFDAIDAVSVAREETRTVPFEKQHDEHVTRIEYYWLIVLSGKVVLTLLLGITNFVLWRAGRECVANDENSLFKLLVKSVYRDSDTEGKIFINREKRHGIVQFWASSSPAKALKHFAG